LQVDVTGAVNDVVRYFEFNPNVEFLLATGSYPLGTLGSDALPNSLPIESANGSLTWSTLWPTAFNISGQITSITVADVPEPSMQLLALIPLVYAPARRRGLE
jgi:hypothetical protein